MTQKSKKQSTTLSAATTTEPSERLSNASSSEVILLGKTPTIPPPRVADYDELDKKAVDVLVDSLKYIATTCGIVIAMYSQAVREYVKDPAILHNPPAQSFLFLPLILWFVTIIATVIGIFPRQYRAITDAQKETAVRKIRKTKQAWLSGALMPFLIGFATFLYIIGAQIWRIYPFR